MESYPCDQIGADIVTVQTAITEETGVPVSLDYAGVELMVAEVERLRRGGEEITDAIESALWQHEARHEVEYTAYKRVLQKVFERRMGYRQSQNAKHGKYAPFAPR